MIKKNSRNLSKLPAHFDSLYLPWSLSTNMSEINVKAVYTLEENADVEVYAAGVNILLKLLENVIREPYNLKYRKIRFENKIIKEKLLSLPGALELLHSIGFEQVG